MKQFYILLMIGLISSWCFAIDTQHGVYYLDGSFQAGYPTLHKPLLGSQYLSMGDSTRIELDNVKGYADAYGCYLKVETMTGNFAFATRVVEGRISVYRYISSSTTYNGMAGMPGAGWSNAQTNVYYCTAGPDSVFLFSYVNLKPILSGNPRSLRYLNASRNAHKTLYYCIGIGLVSAACGFASLNQDNKKTTGSAVFFSITGVSALTALIYSRNDKYYLGKAIDAYNK